ncbi:unnamed protein product [Trifolium pratense]|uniref:Uncharacterized protein n=2 Tax=Trifolium pratense TaxID=57577 RepID=A0ACB0M2Y1_TRIPR|nr:unnamed protein product [Trifolium pratense]
MNFSSTRFQGTHDFEAGPSVRPNNDNTIGPNFPSNFQGNHESEAGPSRTNINNIAHDSMDFDDNFDESQTPYVDMEVTTNVTSTRRRRQGSTVPSNFQGTHDNEAG